MLETLAAVGFGGVLVNRDGYTDEGAAIESEFLGVLGIRPMTSTSGRLAFYDLGAYRRRVNELPPPERDRVLHPLMFSFVKGFYPIEHGPGGTFRWSDSRGELRVENDMQEVRRASIRMTLSAASPPARLTMAGELLSATVDLSPGGVQFVRSIDVPPGRHAIRFVCDGRRADAPSDPRTMVWRIENFDFDEQP